MLESTRNRHFRLRAMQPTRHAHTVTGLLFVISFVIPPGKGSNGFPNENKVGCVVFQGLPCLCTCVKETAEPEQRAGEEPAPLTLYVTSVFT